MSFPVRGRRYMGLSLLATAMTAALLLLGHQTDSNQRVLAALLPSAYSSPPNIQVDALEALAHVPVIGEDVHGNSQQPYQWHTEAKLRQLTACMALGNCAKNAEKIIIMNFWYCHIALYDGYMGGEGVWCRQMKDSLERQGYTTLFVNSNWEYVYHIYRQFPDLVRLVVSDDHPHNKRSRPFLKSKDRPDGIPAWKNFRYNYFAQDIGSMVGDRWTMTSEPEWRKEGHEGVQNLTYIGYALDPDLAHTPSIPFAQKPYRAYVLGKHATFFYEGAHPAWPRDFFARALKQIRHLYPDFEFVGGFFDERSEDDKKTHGPRPVPDGIRNVGRMNASRFDEELRQARVLVGIGWPTASPSPYRGFARGVPFISPFKVNQGGSPDDPYTWSDSQHDSLRFEQPPIVYNVEEGDFDSFLGAILTALRTELPPFVFPRMTRDAFDERVRTWAETDWRTEAARILDARVAGHETQRNPFGELFEI